MPSSQEYSRLHITPLDDKLITVVLSTSLRSQARNISYHTLESFPERRYGYVELPLEEAEKLRKKLNGTTLRGAKMKIEKAREESSWRAEPEEGKPERKRKREKTEDGTVSRKKSKDPNVLEGIMPKDRKVKRGWTESPAETKEKKAKRGSKKSKTDGDGEEKKDKKNKEKQRTKSKHTDEPECLLNVTIPPDAMKNLSTDEADKLRQKKKKKSGSEREYTVHEFDNTTRFPSFLKNSTTGDGSAKATDFVEGKGWVDGDGNLVETVKESSRPKVVKKEKKAKKAPEPVEPEEDDTSSSGTSSSGSDPSDEDLDEDTPTPEKAKAELGSSKATAEVQPDTASDSSESSSTTPKKPQPTPPSSSVKPLSITIPPPATPSKDIHPLEALYKRQPADSTSTPAPQPEAFSFFSGNADTSDIDMEGDTNPTTQTRQYSQPPMTPFTKQDLDFRHMRSAAPTPDTAHPSRMQSFFSDIDTLEERAEEDDEDRQDGDDDEIAHENDRDDDKGKQPAGEEGEEKSEFQSWFWENRRDLNKNWMQRRKDAAKERRYRENKMRASKAV